MVVTLCSFVFSLGELPVIADRILERYPVVVVRKKIGEGLRLNPTSPYEVSPRFLKSHVFNSV